MSRKADSTREKSKREQMIDAILGIDEEMSDESASQILGLYGLTDNDLVNSFKAALARRLADLPANSEEVRNVGGLLKNVRDHQKVITGQNLSPRERISNLVDGLLLPPVSANFAFRDRKEGELPDADKEILEGLKQELRDGSDKGGE